MYKGDINYLAIEIFFSGSSPARANYYDHGFSHGVIDHRSQVGRDS